MEEKNSSNVINAQLQNWNNFCQYHALGDWYGTWIKYDTEAKVIDKFQCIRSLYTNADKSVIEHQNHYTYASGETETKKFGPYKKPLTNALFLENSFSWGSDIVKYNSPFGFEIGFEHQERRISVAVLYNRDGKPENITTISEYLNNFIHTSNEFVYEKPNDSWQGTLATIGSDLLTEPSKKSLWREIRELTSLDKDYYIFHFSNGSLWIPGI